MGFIDSDHPHNNIISYDGDGNAISDHISGSYWIVLAIGTIIYFYGGQPFFNGAKTELKNRKPTMMTLIMMGITVTYFYSLYSVFANNVFHIHPMITDFFWEVAILIDIMLVGIL